MFSIYYLRRYERIHQLFSFIYCLFLHLLPSSPNHSFEQTPCCSPSPPSIRFSSSLESLPPPTYSFSTCKNSTQIHFRKKTHFRIRSSALTKKRRYRWISWTLRGSEMNVTNRALIIKSGLIRKDQNLKLLYCIIYGVISEDWDDQKYVNW